MYGDAADRPDLTAPANTGTKPDWWPADVPWPPPNIPGPNAPGAQPLPGGGYSLPSVPSGLPTGTPPPGWTPQYAPGTAPPPPAPAAGPGSPTTPNLLGVNTPTTPPGMLDLGGPPGLTYIPPTPDFSGSRPTFNAPSVADAANDPGQQFRMQQGENALQNWAASKGTLDDSSTAKALEDYGQAAGQQGYADVWNRNFAKYQGDVGTWQTGLVNPTMTAWQTRAAAGEFQNQQNYNDWWNQIVNNQNNAKWFADHA